MARVYARKPKKERIFLDHAAGAKGNPSAIYREGVEARKELEAARKTMAGLIACHSDEIVFTSGGTEANNLAILGTLRQAQGSHCVTTNIEHASVREPVAYLERQGHAVTRVPVEANGIVDPEKIRRVITKDTVLVSVMYVNNEIGTVQPIKEIAKIIRRSRPTLFHIDACQAPGVLPLDLAKIDGVDMVSFSAQKFGGPVGVGCLFVRRTVQLQPFLYGGGQEFGRRPGTENVTGAVAMATAFLLAEKRREKEVARLAKLRDYFFDRLFALIPNVIVNGDRVQRSANNVNVSFDGVDGEMVVLALDAAGVAVSSGSACASRDGTPSYVVQALGGGAKRAGSAVRFSLSGETTKREIDEVLKLLPRVIERQRRFQ